VFGIVVFKNLYASHRPFRRKELNHNKPEIEERCHGKTPEEQVILTIGRSTVLGYTREVAFPKRESRIRNSENE
jgi:hypothetical protein